MDNGGYVVFNYGDSGWAAFSESATFLVGRGPDMKFNSDDFLAYWAVAREKVKAESLNYDGREYHLLHKYVAELRKMGWRMNELSPDVSINL